MKKKDTIVKQVIKEYKQRSKRGIKEYGTTLDREDWSLTKWLSELKSELQDATLYITKIQKEILALENKLNEYKRIIKKDKRSRKNR